MFYQNSVKMLKLVCLYNTQRSNLFQSLALGYSYILTRSSSFSSNKALLHSGDRMRNQSVSANNIKHEVDGGYNHKISPSLLNIAHQAEIFLGRDRFSVESSMTHNFGDFRDIITLFLFKVAHIDHPLLYLTKIVEAEPSQNLNGTGQNPYLLWRAMMVLLATEKFGYNKQISDSSLEKKRIALDRLNRMTKIVEITHVTQQIHKRIVDISGIKDPNSHIPEIEQNEYIENLHKANKAAALIGDLLWTQKCLHMAALNCQPATGLICRFLMEYCESEFVFGVNSVKAEQFTHEAWIQKCQLGIGSLMGNTMSIMLLFAGHEDDAMRNRGFALGSLLGLMYQAYDDIKYFERNELTEPTWLDIGLLPVVYKIQSDGNLFNKSHKEIFYKVKEDITIMTRAKETFYNLQDETLRCLTAMKPYESSSEAGDILAHFVRTLDV